LNAFGEVSRLVFLRLRVDEPAQLARAAINVYVDLVESVFGIVAHCAADLTPERLVINVLAGAARV
jgi:hypothetical protein